MSTPEVPPGLVVWCDLGGVIEEVLHDEMGLLASQGVGMRLVDACDPMSKPKFNRLLAEARTNRAALGWQINMHAGDEIIRVYFTAAVSADRVLLIGGSDHASNTRLYEELVRVNNDQTNALRSALKELELSRSQITRDQGSNLDLEEFARLNNELITLQRELGRRNAELSRVNEMKNQFLGMAAHDLRNPLGAISGFATLLTSGAVGPVTEKQHDLLARIERSSSFMLGLVTDLLEYSKIESGMLELRKSEVDLAELIESTALLYEPQAAQKQMTISRKYDGLPKRSWVDADKMEQVLSNLISNAIKYSNPGAEIRVNAVARPGEVIIEVTDEGEGIPADELGAIFLPFKISSVKSTGGEKSTGLGLAIVSRIIKGHGGEITVESEAGRGSTFTVVIPIQSASA